MYVTHRPRTRERRLTALLVLVTVVGAIAVGAAPASASNEPIVIPFEKHWVGPGHYVGTAGAGGTIEMFVYDSSVTGSMQHFTVTVNATVPAGSFTAVLDGTFNFSTAKTLLNGVVTDGWLQGAQAHEKGQLVGLDPLTFSGTLQLMPASA